MLRPRRDMFRVVMICRAPFAQCLLRHVAILPVDFAAASAGLGWKVPGVMRLMGMSSLGEAAVSFDPAAAGMWATW